uniref:hypothetical protein n=1 Tax=Cyanothece sp. BG0011 TaxID=2082950 RepID=UPI0018E58E18|nr:hypothetical protein [Cyanothece sp. BG0011]
MPFLLPSHPWRISYSSNENNPIADFYIPALERAVQYDRKSGFFNSAILSKVARGLGAMLYNEGKMRLIMGCQFSPQDLTAIQQGYELKEAISTCLDRELEPPKTLAQLKHFEILSWLIAHHYLEIKIAIPLRDNGLPEPDKPLDTRHIFHEKIGIFTDVEGNQLMRELKDKTRSLLLLSATPMQIDTVEVFDLLSLVNLKGEWQYQDNFCDYFDSLAYPPDRLRLEFWQRMSTNYFQHGGQLCPLLEQQYSQQDRLLFYRLKDIWQSGMAMVNHKQLCQDDNFVQASRQFLTLNTPLKHLMNFLL